MLILAITLAWVLEQKGIILDISGKIQCPKNISLTTSVSKHEKQIMDNGVLH